MPRKKKQVIKVNDSTSLEAAMQEVYNDACSGIKEAQTVINELRNSTTAEDVDEATKISHQLISAGKQKTDNVKLKLEVAKLQFDSLKHGGNAAKAIEGRYGEKPSEDDFGSVREMIEKNAFADDNEVDKDK